MMINIETGVDGLSPPTRGSRFFVGLHGLRPRSIPAHAGEPISACGRASPLKVYPRPRGGARREFVLQLDIEGLSPPTRGSRRLRFSCTQYRGSIPAHAGEPAMPPASDIAPRVYPRPRGGAADMQVMAQANHGLSPPTRGSPPFGEARGTPQGSIPAHAGEPGNRVGIDTAPGVYPRPRGGASRITYLKHP